MRGSGLLGDPGLAVGRGYFGLRVQCLQSSFIVSRSQERGRAVRMMGVSIVLSETLIRSTLTLVFLAMKMDKQESCRMRSRCLQIQFHLGLQSFVRTTILSSMYIQASIGNKFEALRQAPPNQQRIIIQVFISRSLRMLPIFATGWLLVARFIFHLCIAKVIQNPAFACPGKI